jgi:hypothetical protein
MPEIPLTETAVIGNNAPDIPKQQRAWQVIQKCRVHKEYGDQES